MFMLIYILFLNRKPSKTAVAEGTVSRCIKLLIIVELLHCRRMPFFPRYSLSYTLLHICSTHPIDNAWCIAQLLTSLINLCPIEVSLVFFRGWGQCALSLPTPVKGPVYSKGRTKGVWKQKGARLCAYCCRTYSLALSLDYFGQPFFSYGATVQ